MADIANRLLLILVLLLVSCAVMFGQAAPHQCGYDRWPVKILSDKDREKVNFTAVETTIAGLAGIPIHEVPYPRERRIPPEELKVYKLHAKLIQVRPEKDSDLHLILADPEKPDIRMIAEIPAPQCAEDPRHEEDYRKARDELSKISIGSLVEITGVGFFDFLHDATGGAKNGIELHPVLKIVAIK